MMKNLKTGAMFLLFAALAFLLGVNLGTCTSHQELRQKLATHEAKFSKYEIAMKESRALVKQARAEILRLTYPDTTETEEEKQ